MVFNLFFITITISKRHFSKADLERAYQAQLNEKLFENNKQQMMTIKQYI
jgi:uncharacterized protein (TIGR02413 family)